MWLVASVFIIGGILIFLTAIYAMKMGKQSLTWPATEARVIKKGIMTSTGTGGSVVSSRYEVTYEYEVNGQKFLSNRTSFRPAVIPTYKDKARFEGVQTLTVYYSPENPETSVIDRGVDFSNYLAFPASVLFVGAGIVLAVWDF